MKRVAALVFVVIALAPQPASATFHEMWIREVYPGSVAQPGSEYVELQMWASGQHLVDGHSITFYDAGGGSLGSETFSANVASGANQSTVLAATTAASGEFGVAPDLTIAPEKLNPAGGAVCWASLDCVSWGSFSGGGSLPSPAGSPASPAGIPDGMALRRSIAPGCATLLEAGDDRSNSAVDFSPVFPEPRPNSVAPSERACSSQQGPYGGPGQSGRGAPQTKLRRKPPQRTRDRTPTFRFASDEARSTFQCKLDRKPYRSCRSPFTTKRLGLGPHTFRVRARDESGRLDPSPAVDRFTVIEKR